MEKDVIIIVKDWKDVKSFPVSGFPPEKMTENRRIPCQNNFAGV